MIFVLHVFCLVLWPSTFAILADMRRIRVWDVTSKECNADKGRSYSKSIENNKMLHLQERGPLKKNFEKKIWLLKIEFLYRHDKCS